jgi:hypothetical protein
MSNDVGINAQVYGNGPWLHLTWWEKGGTFREEAVDARRVVRVTRNVDGGCVLTIHGDASDLYLPGVSVMDVLDYIDGALARAATMT